MKIDFNEPQFIYFLKNIVDIENGNYHEIQDKCYGNNNWILQWISNCEWLRNGGDIAPISNIDPGLLAILDAIYLQNELNRELVTLESIDLFYNLSTDLFLEDNFENYIRVYDSVSAALFNRYYSSVQKLGYGRYIDIYAWEVYWKIEQITGIELEYLYALNDAVEGYYSVDEMDGVLESLDIHLSHDLIDESLLYLDFSKLPISIKSKIIDITESYIEERIETDEFSVKEDIITIDSEEIISDEFNCFIYISEIIDEFYKCKIYQK